MEPLLLTSASRLEVSTPVGSVLVRSSLHRRDRNLSNSYHSSPDRTVAELPIRDFDHVFGDPVPGTMDYGLFVHLIHDASLLVGGGIVETREAIRYPWEYSVARRRGQSAPQLSKRIRDIFRLVALVVRGPIRIVKGSIQQLVSLQSDSPTAFDFISAFELDLTAVVSGGPNLIFHVFRPVTIARPDLTSILRLKISECLDLSTEKVTTLLDQTIPLLFIPEFRTQDDLVALSYSYPLQRSDGPSREPTLQWEPLRISLGSGSPARSR